jgi:hypothetical protein
VILHGTRLSVGNVGIGTFGRNVALPFYIEPKEYLISHQRDAVDKGLKLHRMSNIAQKCIELQINIMPYALRSDRETMNPSPYNPYKGVADFWVEVRHRRPPPKRYTWEIHCKGVCLSVEESGGQFGSWEEASQAGKKALIQFLQARQSAPYSSDFLQRPRRSRGHLSLLPSRDPKTTRADEKVIRVSGRPRNA